jgi:hypothetical protein
MSSAVAMILRCAGNAMQGDLLANVAALEARLAAVTRLTGHPRDECAALGEKRTGPNLVLWTGARHALALELKEDG